MVIDPVYSAHGVIKTAQQGDIVATAKQFDPTGISSIPDIYNTGKKALNGDAYSQGQLLGMLPGLYGGIKAARTGGVKLSAELPEGYVKAGFSFESISSSFSEFGKSLGKCVEYARDFAKKYTKNIQKEGGSVKVYEINIGGGGLIGTAEQQLANNGMHRFVEVTINGETKIYDNFHTEGIPKADYMKNVEGYNKGQIITGENLIKNNTKEVKP